MSTPQPPPRLLFVTGKLAEPALRELLAELAPRAGFVAEVTVLNIAVAALMTTAWVARKLTVPAGVERVILPGHCLGELEALAGVVGSARVERGPGDLRDLPMMFGQSAAASAGYGSWDIEIVAEINHAPRLATTELLAAAECFRQQGADLIDVGCDPDGPWVGLPAAVRALRDAGHRVSVDSLHPIEIRSAVEAGAELVLSVNASNRAVLADLPPGGPEVVAIPDVPGEPAALDQLAETVAAVRERGLAVRADPVLEPIGFGLTASLERYWTVRRRWPSLPMLMGVGNLTELTGVDSVGVNVLLAAVCQELGVTRVLTTAVANWARSSVRELSLARRLVRHAVARRVLPKYLEPGLHLLRDAKPRPFGEAALRAMAAGTRDRNFRIFAEGGRLYVFNSELFLSGRDAFDLFAELLAATGTAGCPIEPSHAFYLGWELHKAATALTLGKSYRQDQSLDWGFLTAAEVSHRSDRRTERPL